MEFRAQPMRIGIAGAGAFAKFLAASLGHVPECQLVAVAGRSPDKRRAVIQAWRQARADAVDVSTYDDARELVHADAVDAVLVCTPPNLHAELARAYLESGKHVLLEKPGALRASHLSDIARMAQRHQRAVTVNLVMPHSSLMQAVERLLEVEALGPVDAASMHNQVHRVADGHWFWNAEQSGGIWIEHGVHFFEVGRRWFGTPVYWQSGTTPTELGSASSMASVPPRVWATVWHRRGHHTVPVHYYHGFIRPEEAAEFTRWEIVCRYGRIGVQGWVPMQLDVEGMVPADWVEPLGELLDAVPTDGAPEGADRFEQVAAGLTEVAAMMPGAGEHSRGKRVLFRRTIALRNRTAEYQNCVRARFLDLYRAAVHPGHRPRVTMEDAVADLALAEACTQSVVVH
ncbi:hypothetical protein GCM10025857_06210 [Alicyclobacillus contaminans]|uniref:Gfo/Idh/MocA family protein n=1 Tax=Alicyclobacillus contaminans TaxID=392016 RepID=UPI00041C31B2|nr:Gfo/Idh/MocA family oxidoreductase [Alicyclobacillus contaminans]GMA49264.1 hypothetical protein GCM10025857_06210 [Alicyclobacillus contaminans]